jgi:hypothetical protein
VAKAWTNREIERAVKLYKLGWNYEKIGDDLGRPFGAVQQKIWQCAKLSKEQQNFVSLRRRRIHSRWTFFSRLRAIAAYKRGMSIQKVAALSNCSSTCVQRLLESRNLTRKKNKIGNVKAIKVKEMYLSGMTCNQIAEHVDNCAESVRQYLHKAGIKQSHKERLQIWGKIKRHTTIMRNVDRKIKSFPEYRYYANRLIGSMWPIIHEYVDPTAKKIRYGNYHIDHRLSVFDGYHNHEPPVSLRILAHPANLQVITAKENTLKSIKSSVTLEQLIKDITAYEAKQGPVFEARHDG